MSRLTVLKLQNNRLKQVPREICDLITTLRELDLSHNELTHLPDAIGNLKSLRKLKVS